MEVIRSAAAGGSILLGAARAEFAGNISGVAQRPNVAGRGFQPRINHDDRHVRERGVVSQTR